MERTMINLKKFIKYKPENEKEWKVYFLLNRNKIVYIGFTNNITRRLQYHSHYYDPFMSGQMKCYLGIKKFTSYRYIVIKDKKKAYALEHKLIKKYMPLYNNNKNYYWKPTAEIIYSDKAREELARPQRRQPFDKAKEEQSIFLVANTIGDSNYNDMKPEERKKEWTEFLNSNEDAYTEVRNQAMKQGTTVDKLVEHLSTQETKQTRDYLETNIEKREEILKRLEGFGDPKIISLNQKKLQSEQEDLRNLSLTEAGASAEQRGLPQWAFDLLYKRDVKKDKENPIKEKALMGAVWVGQGEYVPVGGKEFKYNLLNDPKSILTGTQINQRETVRAMNSAMNNVRNTAFTDKHLKKLKDKESVEVLINELTKKNVKPKESKQLMQVIITKINDINDRLKEDKKSEIKIPKYENIRQKTSFKEKSEINPKGLVYDEFGQIVKVEENFPNDSDIDNKRVRAKNFLIELGNNLTNYKKALNEELLTEKRSGKVFKTGWNERKYSNEIQKAVDMKPVEQQESLGKNKQTANQSALAEFDEDGRRMSLVRGATRQFSNNKQLLKFMNYVNTKMQNPSVETQEDRDYLKRAMKEGRIESEDVALQAKIDPDTGGVVRGTVGLTKKVPKKGEILNWNDFRYALGGDGAQYLIQLKKADGTVETMYDPNKVAQRYDQMSKNARYNTRKRLEKARQDAKKVVIEDVSNMVDMNQFKIKGDKKKTIERIAEGFEPRSRYGLD